MRRAVNIGILILLSAAIVVAIVVKVGLRETVKAVAEAGPLAFGAVGALTLISLLVQALTWEILNRPIHHRVRFRTLVSASIVGLAGNIITPSTFLGGEPFKILYVGRAARLRYQEVAGTVMLSKYLEGISFIFLFAVCTAVAAVTHQDVLFGPYLAAGVTILVVAAALLALGVVLWISLSRRWHPLTTVIGSLARLPISIRRIARLRQQFREMEDQASRVFREEAGVARAVLALHVVGHAAVFLKPAVFFFLGAHVPLSLGQLCLIYIVSQALLSFQLTPSGAGTLDGGLIGTFALMGFDRTHYLAKCVAFLLCLRLWDFLLVGGGGFLLARMGLRLLAPAPEPAPSPRPPDTTAPPP